LILLTSGRTLDQEALVKTGDQIAFLGDSITEAGAGHPGGYVQLVVSGLAANDIKVKMIPAGISGHKSDQMLERLQRDVNSKKPAWMTLSCGVNDVWHGANGVPLEAYRKNITAIVDQAQAAGIQVMILTSTMIGEDALNPNNLRLAEYNAFLRSLAKEKNCLLADLNADMQAAIQPASAGGKRIELQLTSDGVHMGPLGDRLMAHGILRAFGLSESQLERANEAWLDAPGTAGVGANLALTLRQYAQISALALGQGKSVDELVSAAFNQSIEGLLHQANVKETRRYGARCLELQIGDVQGFVILPTAPAADGSKPWVWYAPSYWQGYPNERMNWLFSRLLQQGFAICGTSVGDSFGSPQSRKIYSQFYAHVVKEYGLAPQVCLLPQSRGGLMWYNWAVENPEKVACIGGIYPVCDLTSYPGLGATAAAYGMSEPELTAQLAQHNPIERLAPLAKAKVPILHLHGDKDDVVPLERNSGLLIKRYQALGGPGELAVIRGKGHAEIPEFFESEKLLEFFLRLGK
jgi:lysophospholipase L1-like esterase/pimeloyl-ACP methyl ester carboxylesterase